MTLSLVQSIALLLLAPHAWGQSPGASQAATGSNEADDTTSPPSPLPRACPTDCATEYFQNLPEEWESDYRRVMDNLTPLLGFYDIDIVAWPSSEPPPTLDGHSVQPGQYVGGRDDQRGRHRTLMVLEIDLNELRNQHAHRLSVIAHEYFHVYQRNRNPSLRGRFDIKWLIEGSAAVFESMYLDEYEREPNYYQTAQLRHADPQSFGAPMEHYENGEVNYGTSTAMVLLACKEVGFQRMIDFWKRRPTNQNWKRLFEDTFGMSVEALYAAGQAGGLDELKLSAMGSLKTIRY